MITFKITYTICKEERRMDRNGTTLEAAYKWEIINVAEYLNTNHKEGQFVNIVRSHESTQQNMNSIIKTAAKITEELSQPNEKSDTKQDGIQDTKA